MGHDRWTTLRGWDTIPSVVNEDIGMSDPVADMVAEHLADIETHREIVSGRQFPFPQSESSKAEAIALANAIIDVLEQANREAAA